MKIKLVGNRTRPDLSVCALELSRKQSNATIRDLKNINQILKKIPKERTEYCLGELESEEIFVC